MKTTRLPFIRPVCYLCAGIVLSFLQIYHLKNHFDSLETDIRVRKKGVLEKNIFKKTLFYLFVFYLRPFQYARPCAQETKPQFPRSFLLDEGPVSLSMPTELCIEFKLLMMIVFSDLKLFSCVIRIKSFK